MLADVGQNYCNWMGWWLVVGHWLVTPTLSRMDTVAACDKKEDNHCSGGTLGTSTCNHVERVTYCTYVQDLRIPLPSIVRVY